MRLARLVTAAGPCLAVKGRSGYVELASSSYDPRFSDLAAFLAAGDPMIQLAGKLALREGSVTAPLGSLVSETGRIFCLGRNYIDHAMEMGHNRPEWPEVFLRLGSTALGPFDDIPRPSVSECLDYEGELGVMIGTSGRHIAASEALNHVAGLCVVNDVTVRDWQHRGQQWTPGKNFDRTLVTGPALVTLDEVDNLDLHLETRVNDEIVQQADTGSMVFGISAQIEFLSSFTTLRPGDLIATGTPGGVGAGRSPARFLVPGDVVEVTIEQVGTIRNRVTSDDFTAATDRWSQLAAARNQ